MSRIILAIFLLLSMGCERPIKSLGCKDWDSLSDQALHALDLLRNEMGYRANCRNIMDGRVQRDINSFKARAAKTPMDRCSRAAYSEMLSGAQDWLDNIDKPKCEQKTRLTNSTTKLVPLQ